MIPIKSLRDLADVPESIRSIFSCSENGELSLDESKIKTEDDVTKILVAKNKERDAHNEVRKKLEKYEMFGSPEEIQEKFDSFESQVGKGTEQNEKILSLRKELNAKKDALSQVQNELSAIKPIFEQLQKKETERTTEEVLRKSIANIKGADTDKLFRCLKKDVAVGYIALDETGTSLVMKDGSDFTKYAEQTVDDFGFVKKDDVGVSRSTSERISTKAKNNTNKGTFEDTPNYLDEDVAEMLRGS